MSDLKLIAGIAWVVSLLTAYELGNTAHRGTIAKLMDSYALRNTEGAGPNEFVIIAQDARAMIKYKKPWKDSVGESHRLTPYGRW